MRGSSPPLDATGIAAIARRIDRPIVLVGLMGVGKTTVGRRLAALLDRDFVDADQAIEQSAGRSVSEIFADFGEAAFRDGERRVIARLIAEGHGVIATGGGAFVDPATRALVLDQAIAVWLDCPLGVLIERTGRRNTRPLLAAGDPAAILRDLDQARRPFYAEAPVRVDSSGGSYQATAHAILRGIDQWL